MVPLVHPMVAELLVCLFLFYLNFLIHLIFDLYELLFVFDFLRCLRIHCPLAGSLDSKLVETDLSVYKDFPLEGVDFESDCSSLDLLVESLLGSLVAVEDDSFLESLVQLLLNAIPYQFQDYLRALEPKPVN